MNEFSRFENQYIMMLALRARQELTELLANPSGYIDPNIEDYIESLKSIAEKSKANIQSIDKKATKLTNSL